MTLFWLKSANKARSELAALIAAAKRMENDHRALIDALPKRVRPDAANLLHYLALRHYDLRPLQGRLSALGLSSLGRSEAQVLATLTRPDPHSKRTLQLWRMRNTASRSLRECRLSMPF